MNGPGPILPPGVHVILGGSAGGIFTRNYSRKQLLIDHDVLSCGPTPKCESIAAWEAMRLESLMSAAEDLRHAVTRTFGIQDAEELKRRRAELVEGPLRTWAANMEKQIKGPFAGGEQISVADVKLFMVIGWFKKGVLNHVPTDVFSPFPKLERLFTSVKDHPKVVDWYARAR